MKSILILFVIIFISCGAKNNTDNAVNNKYNREYIKSIDGQFGKMDNQDLNLFYKALEENLNITIDTSKTILINYFQKGHNCIVKSNNVEYEKNVLRSYKNSSDKISINYNAKNILVYTKKSFFTKYADNNSGWILDNGFIKNNIFISDKNCSGFFIIRTDGKFYKYYGEDYFSIINKLLRAKEWDYPDKIFE
ncbi:hypothetical protein [Winogradskyella sp.]|uniref:hypothetical protein n=1 Tax=Winogradskyella sp. TaxID=1883156 RepID=UPI0025F0F072|nr:hypothetical protein [Winogradskyella sp.]